MWTFDGPDFDQNTKHYLEKKVSFHMDVDVREKLDESAMKSKDNDS